jgi:hypothetical protein
MRHEAALKRLDELDAGEGPGLALRLHLATCPSCARQAELLRRALDAYRAEAPLRGAPRPEAADRTLEDRIMATLRLTPPPKQDFAVRDWLFPAAVILLSMCLLPLSAGLGFMDPLLGRGAAIYLSLILGLAFTAYSVLLIASHLDELQAFLRNRGLLPR